jgi:hypothetical protein
MNNLPVIAGVEIFVDSEGRYNLNALHKAYERDTGKKQPTKRPVDWLRCKSAREFIEAVKENQGENSHLGFDVLKVVHGGANPGTFAHELIAVEYAGWISPKFRILVNQTFIDYRTGKLQPQPTQTSLSLGEQLVAFGQALIQQERELAELRDKQGKLIYAVKSEIKKRKAADSKIGRLEQRLDAIKTATEYFTIIGYVNYAWDYHADYVPLEEAQRMGRRAARYCVANNIKMGSTPDQRFGEVNTHPLTVLTKLFPAPLI